MIYATSGNLVENISLLSDLLGVIGGIGAIVGGIYGLWRTRKNGGKGRESSGGVGSAIKEKIAIGVIVCGLILLGFVFAKLSAAKEGLPPDDGVTSVSTVTPVLLVPEEPEPSWPHPEFDYFTASSSYNKDAGNNCKPVDAFDGKRNTAWQEGVSGYGEGEYVEARASDYQHVNRVKIVNGYAGVTRLYWQNSRVKTMTIQWEGGSMTVELEDSSAAQVFELGGIDTMWMRFIIEEVYPGDKYKDTCIGDIYFE